MRPLRDRLIRAPHPRALLIPSSLALMLSPGVASGDSQDAYADGHIDVWMVEVDGYDTPKAVVKAMIDAPVGKVWPLIDECARYDETMLSIASSELLKKKGDTHTCRIEVDMPFPLDNLVAVTEADHVAGPKVWSRSWKLVSGDYTVNQGFWKLTPHGPDGSQTMVHYQLLAEPTISIPEWVQKKVQRSTLPKLIEHLRDQAKQ